MSHRVALVTLLASVTTASAVPDGLTFHVSFDQLHANADFAVGDAASSFTESLELRPAEGVKGAALLLRSGERCTYPIAGNLDTAQGTVSLWVKPINWDAGDLKFRHFFVATPERHHTMLLYVYPIGDVQVLNYISVGDRNAGGLTYRAGAPTDVLERNTWVHFATTWDEHEARLYINGLRCGEGIVGKPIPHVETGTFQICPVQFWKHDKWGDPDEQTVCDEVRIFSRALTDDEVLDVYAADAPEGIDLEPELAVELAPRHRDRAIDVTLRPAHLDDAWRDRIAAGATARVKLVDPDGKAILDVDGALGDGRYVAEVGEWVDGDYTLTAELVAGDGRLAAEEVLTKPPTPWLSDERDWRADRVLEPWSPLTREGKTIRYWNGEIGLDGAFPSTHTATAESLLAQPIRIVADAPAQWQSPRVIEETPHRITVTGTGSVGGLEATYTTLVEFDGLVRVDLSLKPAGDAVTLPSLTIEIPIAADQAIYYRNPRCQEWDGQSLDEPQFLPYAWLGNESRGLSWFMESDANWVRGDADPAMTLRREGDAVVVRLHLVTQPVEVGFPLDYTFGFEATPVRPMPGDLYERFLASGPQVKGVNQFVYGWGHQISQLNAGLIAYDPDDQRGLIDKWRAAGKETRSYTCTQCTANLSPEYRFFGAEWHQPYGGAFSGYTRVGDEHPYSLVPVCPRSSFPDFLVWCVQQHVANDWGGGIYTDIDGLKPCDNTLHGCGYVDAFGRKGRTWPIYDHRYVSRRIYTACHDHGKEYYAHAHSNWCAPFHAFTDGWCPGEQYSSGVLGKPWFYMDDIPDRVWRTEFHTPTTGVRTFLLPQLSRLAGREVLEDRRPSESCFVAGLTYGAPLWAGGINQAVTEEIWAVQQAFGMTGVEFVPFWRQTDIRTAADLRIGIWRRGSERLAIVANFGDEECQAELSRDGAKAVWQVEWPVAGEAVEGTTLTVTVPPKRGLLVTVRDR